MTFPDLPLDVQKVKEKELLDLIIAFESSVISDEEFLELFSILIKSGLVWNLQGFYGRIAINLINDGIISRDGVIHAEALAKKVEEISDV